MVTIRVMIVRRFADSNQVLMQCAAAVGHPRLDQDPGQGHSQGDAIVGLPSALSSNLRHVKKRADCLAFP